MESDNVTMHTLLSLALLGMHVNCVLILAESIVKS